MAFNFQATSGTSSASGAALSGGDAASSRHGLNYNSSSNSSRDSNSSSSSSGQALPSHLRPRSRLNFVPVSDDEDKPRTGDNSENMCFLDASLQLISGVPSLVSGLAEAQPPTITSSSAAAASACNASIAVHAHTHASLESRAACFACRVRSIVEPLSKWMSHSNATSRTIVMPPRWPPLHRVMKSIATTLRSRCRQDEVRAKLRTAVADDDDGDVWEEITFEDGTSIYALCEPVILGGADAIDTEEDAAEAFQFALREITIAVGGEKCDSVAAVESFWFAQANIARCRHNALTERIEKGLSRDDVVDCILKLPVPAKCPLVDGVIPFLHLLQQFFSVQPQDNMNPVQCSPLRASCATTAVPHAFGSMKFSFFPLQNEQLIIVLKRFACTADGASHKIMHDAQLPREIELTPYCGSLRLHHSLYHVEQYVGPPVKYILKAFLIHIGYSMRTGHYVTWHCPRGGSLFAFRSEGAKKPVALLESSPAFQQEKLQWYMARYERVRPV